MSSETIGKIITAVLAIALLGFAVAFVAQGAEQHSTSLIAVAIGLVGLVAPSPFSRSSSSSTPRKPRTPPPLPLLLLTLALSGCGAGALGAQADAVAIAAATFAEADTIIVRARAADLDAIVDEARETCRPNGCNEEQAQGFRLRLNERTAHWAPVLACRESVPEALRAWIDAIELAHIAQTAEIGFANVLAAAARASTIYAAAVTCAVAIDPALELPALSLGGGQ
jgi:hypothetical protein